MIRLFHLVPKAYRIGFSIIETRFRRSLLSSSSLLVNDEIPGVLPAQATDFIGRERNDAVSKRRQLVEGVHDAAEPDGDQAQEDELE